MKRVVRVCGLRVSIEVTGLELDPTWDLFGAVPEEPLEGDVALAIRVRASDDPLPPVVGEPTFFHGAVECRSDETQHRLTTPFSEVLVLDEGTRMEMRVLEGALVEPRWYVVVPLFIAFAVAMRYHGLFHLHAAAVVDPEGACTLIVGQSGAGKTTACIGYLEQGWSYLSDDACFLKLGEGGEVEVHGIPKEFHLTEWTLRRFPRLEALCGPVVASTGKRGLDPRRAWPRCRRKRSRRLAGVHAPDGQEAMPRSNAGELFAAALASSALVFIRQLPRQEAHLGIIARLAHLKT